MRSSKTSLARCAISAVIAIGIATGCATKTQPAPAPSARAELSGDSTAPPAPSASEAERLIARTASLTLEVDNPVEDAKHAEAKISELGGLVMSSDQSERTAKLVLRVPADRLAHALDSLAALGKELSREVHASDVTESLADLEAHLINQKALRDRLRDVLERAQKVDELLMVERELARVQAEIDRVEGHLARMRTSVAQSTITLALCGKPEPAPKPKQRIVGPLGAAWWVVKKLWVLRE